MEDKNNRLLLYGIPLIILLLIFIIRATSLGYSDFASYYFGSQLLLRGDYLNAYDTPSLNLIIHQQGYKGLFVSYTPFPPFTSVVFAPFTLFPIGFSKILFNTISCFLFLFTLYRSFKYFSVSPFLLLSVPLIFFTSLRSNIYFGQSYLLLFSLLMEGYMAYKKRQIVLSTSLWGFAILFKVFPALIFFFLLARKDFKAMLYLSVACALLIMSSLLINDFSSWQLYISQIFPRLNNGELNDSFTSIFQSAFMLLKNIFIYDELMNPVAIYNSPYLFIIMLAAFKTFLIGSCVMVTIRRGVNDFLSFAIWMAASVLISPNGSTYSLIIFMIPLLALFSLDISYVQKTTLIFLLLLICNIPIHYFSSFPLLLKFPRLYLLIVFFIAMIFIAEIEFNYKILSAFFVLFLSVESFRLLRKEDKSNYLLTRDEHILIYDYYIGNNTLAYSYWSEQGSKEALTGETVKDSSTKDLMLKDNQIYYKGKKMTDSPDWKKKPMLIDGAYIIYLSDKNRGVGFYTLRKLKLSPAI